MMAAGWGVDCDEVWPNLYIGDEASARNLGFLRSRGITHVLNTAEGVWTDHSFVNLNEEYYQGTGIAYRGLQVSFGIPNQITYLQHYYISQKFLKLKYTSIDVADVGPSKCKDPSLHWMRKRVYIQGFGKRRQMPRSLSDGSFQISYLVSVYGEKIKF